MTIVPTETPVGLRRRAVAESAAVRDEPDPLDTALGGEQEATPSGASTPLPIYSIPLAALASDPAPLQRAEQHGWRVLTRDSSTWRLVDFARDRLVGAASLIQRAPAARRLLRAGVAAAASDRDDVIYEPRILEIGKVGFSALWLCAQGEAEDRFFTLADEPHEQDIDAVLLELAPRARRRLASSVAAAAGGDGPNDLGG